jgi:hypothetical protein
MGSIVNEFNKKKFDAFVERLKKEQPWNEKPFFSYSRDIGHKDEPCYFCGFTGRIPGEGRYIYSPLAEDEEASENQVMAAAILFCGKCESKIEELDVVECDFE